MLTNIQGLVDRLDLSPSKGLMPLFEAVSNAMDAIEERTGNPAGGNIRSGFWKDMIWPRKAGTQRRSWMDLRFQTTGRASPMPTFRRSGKLTLSPR